MTNGYWEPSDKAAYERYIADECAILSAENCALRDQHEFLRKSACNWCEEAGHLSRQRASLLAVIAGMVLAGAAYWGLK